MIASQDTMFDSFEVHELAAMGFGPTGGPLPAASALGEEIPVSNKQTDQRSTLIDDPDLICPNMTNSEFYATMNRLRDKAVKLLGDRLQELESWSNADQDKVALWFGNTTSQTRETLTDGLSRIREIMRGLTDKNYERYSDEALKRTGCVPNPRRDGPPASASVCKRDGTYTIFIGPIFCKTDDEMQRADGVPYDVDSKLLVLIHEISHFPQAMNSEDHFYTVTYSKIRARMRDEFCISNADNIASYVINMPNWRFGKEPVWRP